MLPVSVINLFSIIKYISQHSVGERQEHTRQTPRTVYTLVCVFLECGKPGSS